MAAIQLTADTTRFTADTTQLTADMTYLQVADTVAGGPDGSIHFGTVKTARQRRKELLESLKRIGIADGGPQTKAIIDGAQARGLTPEAIEAELEERIEERAELIGAAREEAEFWKIRAEIAQQMRRDLEIAALLQEIRERDEDEAISLLLLS